MTKHAIELAERALYHRNTFLLRKVGLFAVDAFERGSGYYQRSMSEGQPVGMFVLKRRARVNARAISSDYRLKATVPAPADGTAAFSGDYLSQCSLRTFLTPNEVRGRQRMVHEWLVTSESLTGGIDMATVGDTTDFDITHLEDIDDDTPSDGTVRALVLDELKAQLATAEYLDHVVGRYLELTEFDDIV